MGRRALLLVPVLGFALVPGTSSCSTVRNPAASSTASPFAGIEDELQKALSFEEGPPPPFTAEEIRAANPPGTRHVFRVESEDGSVVMQTVRFLTDDGDRVVMEQELRTLGGELVGEPLRADATWAELREHAAFPPEETYRVRSDGVRFAFGTFDVWIYVVGRANVFVFALDRPGPPIWYGQVGEEGGFGAHTRLVEFEVPDP